MIDFNKTLESTIAMFQSTPEAESIHFSINTEKNLLFCSEARLINTILQNLIGNAIKYRVRDQGHFITVFARKESQGIAFSVSDNGEGISAKPVERVFEMFFRGNLKSSGTGLGLYIVKKALEKLEGSISVVSDPGNGTRFSVFLPSINNCPEKEPLILG